MANEDKVLRALVEQVFPATDDNRRVAFLGLLDGATDEPAVAAALASEKSPVQLDVEEDAAEADPGYVAVADGAASPSDEARARILADAADVEKREQADASFMQDANAQLASQNEDLRASEAELRAEIDRLKAANAQAVPEVPTDPAPAG